jgi:hypothetical protein
MSNKFLELLAVREAEEKRGNEKRTNDVIKKLNRKHDKK